MTIPAHQIDKLNVQFCEAKWGGLFRGQQEKGIYLPEIGSCISAVGIIVMGSHMLIFWIHPSGFLRLISTTFVINGISSFMYHYTNLRSWAHADGMSMLFIAWMISAYIFEEAIQIVDYDRLYIRKSLFSRFIIACFWCLSCGYTWWMIAGAPVNGKLYVDKIFEIMFIIPLTISIGMTLGMMKYYQRSRLPYLSDQVEKMARIRFLFGVVIIIIGASSWIITEQFCDKIDFFKLFPGHLLWHIISAWGMLNCLFYAALLRADDFSMRVSINTGSITVSEQCSCRSILYLLYVSCNFESLKTAWIRCSNVYFMILPAFQFYTYHSFINTNSPAEGIHV